MIVLVAVAVGAMLGAPARFVIDRAVQVRFGTAFPWGTFTVNVTGSLILGLLMGVSAHHHVPAEVVAAVGSGFCGALTTYSTFGYETVGLLTRGAPRSALWNVVGSIAAGVTAAGLGFAIGHVM